jgi:hypothetical protein
MTGCPHDGQDLAGAEGSLPVVQAGPRGAGGPPVRRAGRTLVAPGRPLIAPRRALVAAKTFSPARAYPELPRPIAESGVAP